MSLDRSRLSTSLKAAFDALMPSGSTANLTAMCDAISTAVITEIVDHAEVKSISVNAETGVQLPTNSGIVT